MNLTSGTDQFGPRWARLSARRLDWALRAYHDFVESLHEDIRSRFATGGQNGEAYVVVFGRTQVGKTTLLLDLMGVTAQALPRVSNVLRGGRAYGMSATATAMEYCRSADAKWRLKSKLTDSAFDTDEAMIVALAALRQCMSERRLAEIDPIVASIPCDCFGSSQDNTPRVRMLDLPGDSPTDEAEREHVAKMASSYVPHADLILLVGRADDLSFLRADTLDLPGIRDWQIVPERFRIVTTYSFTPQTVRDKVRSHDGPLDADFFRNELRGEIETFGLRLSDETTPLRLFYPLEFGDSWRRAAQQKEGLFERVDPINEELKRQLHADIEASATEYGRLRSAVKVHLIAHRVKEERLKEWGEKLDELNKQLKLVGVDEARASCGLERVKAAYSGLDELLAGAQEVVKGFVSRFDELTTPPDPDPVSQLKPDRTEFAPCISRFSSQLQDKVLAIRPSAGEDKMRRLWLHLKPDEELDQASLRRAIREAFHKLEHKLSSYLIDAYFPSIFDDFDNDKAALRAAMQSAATTVAFTAANHWKSVANQRIAALRAELDLLLSEEHTMSRALEIAQGRARDFALEIEGEEARIRTFCRHMDEESRWGDKFKRRLLETYAEALSARIQESKQARTPAEALLMLFSAAQLKDEKNSVLIGQP